MTRNWHTWLAILAIALGAKPLRSERPDVTCWLVRGNHTGDCGCFYSHLVSFWLRSGSEGFIIRSARQNRQTARLSGR
jgi:hypothetical protein